MKYAWRIDVGVWTTKRLDEVEDHFNPTLALVRQGHPATRIMGWVEYEPKSSDTLKEGWNAQYMPPDDEEVWFRENVDQDKGPKRRPLLKKGQEKFPRNSAREALECLLEAVKDDIGKSDHVALCKVGPMFLDTLQDAVKTYVPRAARLPGGTARRPPRL